MGVDGWAGFMKQHSENRASMKAALLNKHGSQEETLIELALNGKKLLRKLNDSIHKVTIKHYDDVVAMDPECKLIGPEYCCFVDSTRARLFTSPTMRI